MYFAILTDLRLREPQVPAPAPAPSQQRQHAQPHCLSHICSPTPTLSRSSARRLIAALFTLAGLLSPHTSRAAGGHHAVDDATILDPGTCQMEVWGEQAAGRHLQHLGPACRWADVEVGANAERSDTGNASATLNAGLQAKWVLAIQPGLALGLEWSANWQGPSQGSGQGQAQAQGNGHFTGHTLLLPLTWSARPGLDVHLNVGRDFHPHAADVERYGAAAEWMATPEWQMLVEAWRDDRGPQGRLGVRRLVSERLSLDLSRADVLRGAHHAWWTVGVNWVFGR